MGWRGCSIAAWSRLTVCAVGSGPPPSDPSRTGRPGRVSRLSYRLDIARGPMCARADPRCWVGGPIACGAPRMRQNPGSSCAPAEVALGLDLVAFLAQVGRTPPLDHHLPRSTPGRCRTPHGHTTCNSRSKGTDPDLSASLDCLSALFRRPPVVQSRTDR